ncbi:TetR family transcriptional regulator, partial [Mycobacterium sp. ITM-2017-0098]
QAILPSDTPGLRWLAEQLLEALDSGRFATVPDDE